MDVTVPAGAARLLDFIRDTEVGTEERAGYDVIYGFNQSKISKPVTSMTIDEVLAAQEAWSSRFGSSATGGYQFMRATLSGLRTEFDLRGGQVFDPDLQDRLGFHLLKRRGYEQFVLGAIDRVEFGKRLAQEWASFPVLSATKGAHRQLSRGQSYYAGDKLNKALVKPEQVEAVIAEALSLARSPTNPQAPVCKPETHEEDAVVSEPQIICVERATPLPSPASIGHNGGPALEPATVIAAPVPTTIAQGLSPIEQMNKPVKGAQANLAVGGAGAAALLLINALDIMPLGWRTPEAQLAIGIVVPWALGALANFVASYRARDKRFQPVAE